MSIPLTPPTPDERPLRIAMVVPPWYEVPPNGYGGVEAICAALVDALVLRGHDVTLFGAGEPGTAARFVSVYREPQYRRLGELLPELVHVATVDQLLDTGDFDVIHDHTLAGALSAGTRRAPTVTTAHGEVRGELGDFYAALGDRIRLVAISATQRRLRPGLAWAATVHNSVQVERFHYRTEKERYVLWLARFCRDKAPELAISACRAAGLPLVLAGKCSEPAERAYLDDVVRPLLGPDVEVVLNADRRQTMRLLAGARCLLLPLRWAEPFGMVLIEAGACGTPVVAMARGAVPEIVVPGRTGLICAAESELPAALHAVETIEPADCRNHIRRSFSAEVMARRYEAVYRAAIAARAVTHPLGHPVARPEPAGLSGRAEPAALGPALGSTMLGSAVEATVRGVADVSAPGPAAVRPGAGPRTVGPQAWTADRLRAEAMVADPKTASPS